MSKTFTQADVASHNKPNDLYIIVDEDVYDLTAFQDEHPGTYPSPPQSQFPSPNHKRERWADAVQQQAERKSSLV
jgi:hypothetical protein